MIAPVALTITEVKATIRCSNCEHSFNRGDDVHNLNGKPVCNLCANDDPAAKITDTSREATIKRIRAALKNRSGKVWSVKGDKGTAYGWIHISVPPARYACQRSCSWDKSGTICRFCGEHYLAPNRQEVCPSHTPDRCDGDCYIRYMSPEDRAELAALLGLDGLRSVHQQGVQIMASTDARIEYIDRAEGREPRKIGIAYWE
jgi:hypothetical protein